MLSEDRRRFFFIWSAFVLLALFLLFEPVFEMTGATITATTSGTVQIEITATNVTGGEGNVSGTGSFGGAGIAAPSSFVFAPSALLFGGEGLEPVLIGASLRKQLRIENIGRLTNTFVVSATDDFIAYNPAAFTIRPGETFVLSVFLTAPKAGVHVGKLLLTSEFIELQVPVVLTVSSPEAEFDATLLVPSAFRMLRPGGSLYSQLLINGLEGRTAAVHYSLRDARGRIVAEDLERPRVSDGERLQHILPVPAQLPEGQYVFAVVITHGRTTVSKSMFVTVREGAEIQEAVPSPVVRNPATSLWIVFFLVLSLALVHYRYRKRFEARSSD